mmetsp:Transcript_13826/g.18908  ORF Transcript_13826/g.18908 Transcript_13826/m.18908 type:complete len:147 (-) Transcript_13826:109-549(-)
MDYNVFVNTKMKLTYFFITLMYYVFFGYSVYCTLFHTFLENSMESSFKRQLISNDCSVETVGIATTVGAVAGTLLIGGAFLAIGLSPIGPIAGGLFAANMGAGVAAGGMMAVIQSAAMTGTAYATGAAVGAATAAGAAIGTACASA